MSRWPVSPHMSYCESQRLAIASPVGVVKAKAQQLTTACAATQQHVSFKKRRSYREGVLCRP